MSTRMADQTRMVRQTKTVSSEILEKLQEIFTHISTIEKVVESIDKRVDIIECHVNALVESNTLDN